MKELWVAAEPVIGAQIRVNRGSYYHHGIYAAADTVMHFAAEGGDGLLAAKDVYVRRDTLAGFLGGGFLEVRRYTLRERLAKRRPARIVREAQKRIGEGGYDVLHNNCEDFSNLCAFGKKRRGQIDAYHEQVRKMLSGR